MGEVKKDLKITVIAFVINYLFFYIPVSLYLREGANKSLI